MRFSEFKAFVEKKEAQLRTDDPETFEICFLKVFIRFQMYVGELFVNYAVGKQSEEGYCPKRLVISDSEESFRAFFLSVSGKRYVDYYDLAVHQGKFFFQDNPFNVVLESSNYKLALDQMLAARNCIAHESQEARKAFTDKCLFSQPFVSVGDYLKRPARINGHIYSSVYSHFIETMLDLADIMRRASLI